MFTHAAPRVFNIPSGTPFVDALAARLLEIAGDDPMALAEMRVLLPTRRACRALAEAFLRISGGRAILLPRLMPVGDVDEDELAINEAGTVTGIGAGAADLPPAVSGLKRQMLLTRAVMAIPGEKMQAGPAAALALELAKLIDRLATEDCDPHALKTIVREEYAQHWQTVLTFLNVMIDVWPEILAEEGALDPADRRNRLIRAQADVWRQNPPKAPVIAAGSTGSIPATAELLSVIASLPQGAVVLPGLDTAMSDDAWAHVGPTHAQYGLQQLLRHLGIDRGDVVDWNDTDAEQADRGRVLSLALTPARAALPDLPDGKAVATALENVTRLDCPGPSEEAAAIALIMRETLETPEKTCALVTPDRDLARRVAGELKRWGVEVDDSAGRPLSATPPGAFMRLLADAVQQDLAPVPLLALLKHPLAAAGMAVGDFRALVRMLETAVLRGPRPGPGINGLRLIADGHKDAAKLRPLLQRLDNILSPLSQLLRTGACDFAEALRAHTTAAEALAADNENPGADRLWVGDPGEAMARFIAELADALPALSLLPGREYSGLFERLLAGRAVRPRFGAHPRLFIWGLLEARLQHADTIVLGGLNETTWPPAPETNPWMSRPMMTEIGLSSPERRLGQTAHDFQQAMAAPRVVITRAERIGGTPTVPSRWLLQLQNLFERTGVRDLLHPRPGDAWLGWALALDETEHVPMPAPRPTPPVAARPTRLSVTRIETLIRDPYSIYARYILGLKPLDPIDADPGAADRGNIIHDALKTFLERNPGTLPDDAERRLIDIGRDAFGDHLARPGVRAFWWPRFERIASWFVDWHRNRLAQGWEVRFAEEFGGIIIDAVDTIDGGFEIFAKPDRIDYRPGDGLSIIDYKTGTAPSSKQVESGLSPQLPLEAIIAHAGKFDGVPPEPAHEMLYVKLSGGRTPGEEKRIKPKDGLDEMIEKTRDGVTRMITRFADPKTPYLSRPRPQFESRFGDFDHLARAGAGGGEGDDE